MKSQLTLRMKATLACGAIPRGDDFERSVAEGQFKEAMQRIEYLEKTAERLWVIAMIHCPSKHEQFQELKAIAEELKK